MKKLKRFFALTLVLLTLASITVIPVSASAAYLFTNTTTGCFNGNRKSGAIHVYTNGSTAKLRICTFNQAGARTNGKIIVYAVTDGGATYKWTVTGCNGVSNNTTNITLPAGNTHYTIYIQRASTSSSNITKTFYFSIDYKKNCGHW